MSRLAYSLCTEGVGDKRNPLLPPPPPYSTSPFSAFASHHQYIRLIKSSTATTGYINCSQFCTLTFLENIFFMFLSPIVYHEVALGCQSGEKASPSPSLHPLAPIPLLSNSSLGRSAPQKIELAVTKKCFAPSQKPHFRTLGRKSPRKLENASSVCTAFRAFKIVTSNSKHFLPIHYLYSIIYYGECIPWLEKGGRPFLFSWFDQKNRGGDSLAATPLLHSWSVFTPTRLFTPSTRNADSSISQKANLVHYFAQKSLLPLVD